MEHDPDAASRILGGLALGAGFGALTSLSNGAYVVAIPPVTLGLFAANRLWTFADRERVSKATPSRGGR